MATEPVVLRGNLEYQRKQAKHLHRAFEAGEAEARVRAFDVLGDRAKERFTLNDAQHVLAVEHGFRNWAEFRDELERARESFDDETRPVFRLDALGREDVATFEDRAEQLQADLAKRSIDAVRRVRARLRKYAEVPEDRIAREGISLGDARLVVAREYGYPSFPELAEDVRRVRRELIRPTEPLEAEVIRFIGIGNAAGLREALNRDPGLVNLRSACRETFLAMIAQPEAFGTRFGRELGVDPEVVRVLVEGGSELEGPLNLAAAHNRVELVQMLVDAGADRVARDKTYGITPLQAAVYHGSAEAGDILAQGEISPDALYVAAGAGRVDLLPSYFDGRNLSKRAFAERPNLGDVGWTPRVPPTDDAAEVLGEAFTFACYNGRIEAAQWLLDHGADVDARPYLDMTGLHFAVLGGHREMVKWLLDQGADTTLRDAEHGTTPASWARFAADRNERGPEILTMFDGQR
jgi:hypothetical protein